MVQFVAGQQNAYGREQGQLIHAVTTRVRVAACVRACVTAVSSIYNAAHLGKVFFYSMNHCRTWWPLSVMLLMRCYI